MQNDPVLPRFSVSYARELAIYNAGKNTEIIAASSTIIIIMRIIIIINIFKVVHVDNMQLKQAQQTRKGSLGKGEHTACCFYSVKQRRTPMYTNTLHVEHIRQERGSACEPDPRITAGSASVRRNISLAFLNAAPLRWWGRCGEGRYTVASSEWSWRTTTTCFWEENDGSSYQAPAANICR